MSDRRITELAVTVRNNDERFTGRASVDDVVTVLLEERAEELREPDEKAQEKQASLRSRMGLDDDTDSSGGSDDDVSAKQAELRNKMGR